MRNNIDEQSKIVKKMIKFCTNHSSVKGLIALGSIARQDYNSYSDVDLALIISKDITDLFLYKEISEVFKERTKYKLRFSNPFKGVFYLDKELLKVDLYIVKEIHEIIHLLWGSALENPEKTILYDENDELRNYLRRVKTPNEVVAKDEIGKQIQLFLYAFESFSIAHRTGDGYRSYFEYNLALHRLVRIIYLLRGGIDFLFLPRRFTSTYLTTDEQLTFKRLNGQIYLNVINETKRNLLDFFYAILNELEEKYPSLICKSEIKEFCELIFERDFFWNLRDLSKFAPDIIQNNGIYRSAVLNSYTEYNYFKQWMDKKNIRTIIDLRTDAEINKRPYSKEFLREIVYYNIPLIPTISPNQSGIFLGDVYIWILKHRSRQIKQILKILEKNSSYPVIIHCYAGKDRTGVISAIIHLINETPEINIIKDYLDSSIDLVKDSIHCLLDFIKNEGGIGWYLNKIGISDSTIANIRENLRKK